MQMAGELEKEVSSKDLLRPFKEVFHGPGEQKLGLELEKLALDADSLLPIPMTGKRSVQNLLKQLAEVFYWEPTIDDEGEVIALKRDGQLITVEPGGQIELSSSADQYVDKALEVSQQHFAEINEICADWNVLWCGFGIHPVATLDQVDWLRKERYKKMSHYLASKGKLAHYMMKLSASTQISIDYQNEAEAIEKLQFATRLAPFFAAISANSCFAAGKLSGFKNYRAHIWEHVDKDRCGFPECYFAEDFSFQRYVDFALDVPMIFLARGDKAIGNLNMNFRQFMQSGYQGFRANFSDWQLHLSMLFPEVRLKNFLELRSFDRQGGVRDFSLAVLMKVLFYDEQTFAAVNQLIKSFGRNICVAGMASAAKFGLGGEINQRSMLEFAGEVFKYASAGIARMVKAEKISHYELSCFEQLFELICERGKCPADLLLESYAKHGNLAKIVKAHALTMPNNLDI